MARSTLVLLFLVALSAHPAAAQQPTSEQRGAIRAACRSDFIANCAGVEPGGKEALDCLLLHHDALSVPCKTAVDAVAEKPEARGAITGGDCTAACRYALRTNDHIVGCITRANGVAG